LPSGCCGVQAVTAGRAGMDREAQFTPVEWDVYSSTGGHRVTGSWLLTARRRWSAV
jgi:hypothetical protein